MSDDGQNVEMQDEYDFSQAQQGPAISPSPGKTRITIRIDNDILEWFRKQVHQQHGGNYQTLINEALRFHILRSREPLRLSLEPPEDRRDVICEAGQNPPLLLRTWVSADQEALRQLVREVVREELERTR